MGLGFWPLLRTHYSAFGFIKQLTWLLFIVLLLFSK